MDDTKNVQTHKNKEAEFLRKHLPTEYTKKVCEKLGVQPTKENCERVRFVRYGRIKDARIFLQLLTVAQEEKQIKDEIDSIINSKIPESTID